MIGYDTIYAHQDREDDALIGIKSTALLFGERTKPMLALFYALAVVLIALAGWSAGAGVVFALGLVAFAAHLPGRSRLDIDDPVSCLAVFKSNRDAGLILFGPSAASAPLRHPADVSERRLARRDRRHHLQLDHPDAVPPRTYTYASSKLRWSRLGDGLPSIRNARTALNGGSYIACPRRRDAARAR